MAHDTGCARAPPTLSLASGRARGLLPTPNLHPPPPPLAHAQVSPKHLVPLLLVLLFTVPFCFVPARRNTWVGDFATWAFVSLLLSGLLAAGASAIYITKCAL